MAHGTLENLSKSSFVRTPPSLGARIYQYVLAFPSSDNQALVTVLDPAAGEGDLLLPLVDVAASCRLSCTGIEISQERAAVARTRLSRLLPTILPSAYEGVKLPEQSISLAVLNPPYLQVNGQRAEYAFVTRTTRTLCVGGIMVAILPARSAWDHRMVNFWARWFDQIRVWKVPSEAEGEEESPFEKYRQIVVVGRKRETAGDPDEERIQALLAYRWRKDPVHKDQEDWVGHVAPPTLPSAPLPDPYLVPSVSTVPLYEVQHADEALILETLLGTEEQVGVGAYSSAEWAQATAWQEEAVVDRPTMPYTGVAHVAAEIMTGMLGGEVIELDGMPHLLTAFVGSEWSKMTLDADTKENLRSKGVVKASAKQLQDYPVLGVLNLTRGQTTYYEGNAVFDVLAPWIPTLATYAQQKRPPLYQLDPFDWELQVMTNLAQDKQLPQAPFPGLAPAQMHRVFAMGRTLDARRLVAIQGEPGTGKTRLATATAARQAFAWQQLRTAGDTAHPVWMRKLRRTWLKNPRTRAMLQLEPVYGERLPNSPQGEARVREIVGSQQLVAYRHQSSGKLVLPEQAGPQALPVLVTTPKKVTKEYEKEIQAAWPEAETVMVQRHTDLVRWLERCVVSSAPAVIAICSHSQSQPRGSGRVWEPAVIEKQRRRHVPVMDPPEDLLPLLEPIVDKQTQEICGYRFRTTGQPLLHEEVSTFYQCPDCFGLISGIPDRLKSARSNSSDSEISELLQEEDEEEKYAHLKSTVTSRTWFEKKPRWCQCGDARNERRVQQRKCRVKAPLWTQARVASTQQKYPGISFQQWAQVMETTIIPPLVVGAETRRSERETQDVRASLLNASGPGPVTHALETGTDRETRAGRGEFGAKKENPLAPQSGTLFSSEEPSVPRRESRLAPSSEGMATIRIPHPQEPDQVLWYEQTPPPPDSFGVYEYLMRFFKGCVALTIVDESHNGRGQTSDIARALHRAMLSAQSHMLTSGTHYGGDIVSFYFYWFRFYPRFWKRLGLTWSQASEALRRYGVIQLWVKEYESEARTGGGKTDVQISTVPAPGLSAKLLPYLLENLCFLTVLDVGAFMPPKVEIPEIVSMRDPLVDAKAREAEEILIKPRATLHHLKAEQQRLFTAVRDGQATPAALQDWTRREEEAQQALVLAQEESQKLKAWVTEHDLLGTYLSIVKVLAEKARKGNPVARMAQGTIPRWYAILPFEKPYELWQTERSTWGDNLEKKLVIKTPQLAWDYMYPLEKRMLTLVQNELAEGRRVMLYVDQNQERSTARRLEWVLQQAEIASWTLPNSVKPEDRQQKIIEVMKVQADGRTPVQVAIVPYARVNEGINLQSVVDSIIWYELALNLFMLEQASRRAWRLGKREEVHIYYLAYAGTAGHQKLRKLGGQSGAAAAFAGEPARGALIEEAGADQTTLARLSEAVEAELLLEPDASSDVAALFDAEDAQELAHAFARRGAEEREALRRGRSWLGATDTLAERLPILYRQERVSPWRPKQFYTQVILVEGAQEEIIDEVCTTTGAIPVHMLAGTVKPGTTEQLGIDDDPSTFSEPAICCDAYEENQKSIPVAFLETAHPLLQPEPSFLNSGEVRTPTELPGKFSKPCSEETLCEEAVLDVKEQLSMLVLHNVASEEMLVSPENADTPRPVPTLVFGNEEHIHLARQRRVKGRKSNGETKAPKVPRKPKIEVKVREIPAATELTTQVEPAQQAVREPKPTEAKKGVALLPVQTLWDFIEKQEAQTTNPVPMVEPKPKELSSLEIEALFVQAKTSAEAYETLKCWYYEHATPVTTAASVIYAIWRMDLADTWAVRYFVDDSTPVEKCVTGFHGQEDAIAFLRHLAVGRHLSEFTFQHFSQELLTRTQHVLISDVK